jgi:hypothetical protein
MEGGISTCLGEKQVWVTCKWKVRLVLKVKYYRIRIERVHSPSVLGRQGGREIINDKS